MNPGGIVDCVTHFFSCDWGTTSFRLRRVNAVDGSVVAEQREATGVRALQARYPAGDRAARAEVFAGFLREHLRGMMGNNLAALAGIPVAISGMASSSVGWRELPYARLPVGVDGAGISQEVFDLEFDGGSTRMPIRLISGVRTDTEIMRGEEVEIMGLFAEGRHAALAQNSIVVLPGTHSKHVRLRDRQITDFHTFLTGELFDVLATHSLLAASVGDAGSVLPLSETSAREAFLDGVRTVAENGLARGLFQTRTRTVLQNVPPAANRWFLSGLLIGAEIKDLVERAPGVPILLAAPESLSLPYELALKTLQPAERLAAVPPAEMSLASVRGQLMLLSANLKASGRLRA